MYLYVCGRDVEIVVLVLGSFGSFGSFGSSPVVVVLSVVVAMNGWMEPMRPGVLTGRREGVYCLFIFSGGRRVC